MKKICENGGKITKIVKFEINKKTFLDGIGYPNKLYKVYGL